ncbi:CHAT domain-containing protein [Nostoc punctiforme]|uniref:GUN4-like protein n=1 Tax=Nostoc punctiforme (strain ATCC 29133 / PCC 73102) TaxID=63737 RepID=B2JB79_NOSP7|nr:CHAT domain-containing protein [Nostoc punctiforme]ACC85183.1 GUN4-like protein [Nostoc punctiforme PCC 73102]
MKIFHISLTMQGNKNVSLRYFWDNASNYKEHELPLAEIQELRDRADTRYYTNLAEDYATTGKELYKWLDKCDRLLANALNQPRQQGLVIAIATDKGLAHLPWELLHDGEDFLVKKRPSIIPVRWVSKGQQKAIELLKSPDANSPENRPLNLLFMASSPKGVESELGELEYEAEEADILEATARTPVDLRVEESGWLKELEYVVNGYQNDLDVFHLTGHATHQNGNPCFLTEDEYGDCVYSNSGNIYDTVRSSFPSLIFLCGCRTGHSSDGVVPSMAEELLNMGATAVLGWGEKVRDTEASAASSKFYGELSQGISITQALSSTYQVLIDKGARDWHKLRFYIAATLPQSLVTRSRTPRRRQLPKPSNEVEFRDDEKRLRVATRENFVGRRRQLQNCLRTLKTDDEKVGVLIHGMGGWGKSSIASRLWDRLPEHEKVLWWRQIDESKLIKKLLSKLIKPELQEIRSFLETSGKSLDIKLTHLFNQLAEIGEKPFLLILDDFEWNLDPDEGQHVLKAEVAPILEALVQAIQETGTNNRIIITCRYDFDSELLEFFYKEGLEPLKDAELTKKLSRLKHFSSGKISDSLLRRALDLADGNPRLLEFFDGILSCVDAEAKLTQLEQSPELWKYKIIWKELYQLIDEPLQKILSHCLVYKIPVPMVALEAACDELPNYQQQLQRGLKLGLIEVSSNLQEENRIYRASRILPHLIPNIKLPEAPEVYSLCQKAHEKLHQLWGNKENKSEEKWQEIFQLKFANKENPKRFRQGFSEMLAVQYNSEADQAFEGELRKCTNELLEDKLCTKLENYLQQQHWKEADEETAWIFYQVMVRENYRMWRELLENFPCETLREINRLWLQNSNNNWLSQTRYVKLTKEIPI